MSQALPVDLPLHDPALWPLRMRRAEVARVLRCDVKTLYTRIRTGRFPHPDSDGMWARAVVQRYLEGGIQEFDRRASRSARRGTVSTFNNARTA